MTQPERERIETFRKALELALQRITGKNIVIDLDNQTRVIIEPVQPGDSITSDGETIEVICNV